jgi:hypothetical protein
MKKLHGIEQEPKKMVKSFAAGKKVTGISINCNACGKPIALLVE